MMFSLEILVSEHQEERVRANFRERLEQAIGRTQRDDFEVLRRLESVLRPERREHFFVVGYRKRAMFVFHARGDENQVAFDRASLVRWLDNVDPDDAFAIHSHPQPSSAYPSRPDRLMTEDLFELEPIREHFIVSPSADDNRFQIYVFSRRTTMVLDTLECADDERQLSAARRRRR